MQNHNFNDQGNRSDASQNRAGHTYEYVFSNQFTSGNTGEQPPHSGGNRNGKFAARFFSVLLVVLLAFGAGYGGVRLAYRGMPPVVEDEGNGEENPGAIQEITPNQGAIHETPEDVLSKVEPGNSPYGSAGEDVFAISDVVKLVEDAVVVIHTTIVSNSIWGTTTGSGAGSGVIVSEDGYILTCDHVIEGATHIYVTLNNGEEYEASLVGRDEATDLAVLKIDAEEPLSFVKQGCSADLIVGEYIVAIGNPLGTLGGTVTKGIISSTERRIKMSDGTVMTLLQTDAAINSGNSGGGLFNLKGELIGVVNAKYTASGVEGLGFAIPIDTAYKVELDLIRYTYVRGVIDHGLSMVDVTPSNLQQYYRHYRITETGLYVTATEFCDSFRRWDRILSVNGIQVETEEEFTTAISQCAVGDEITIVADRSGEEFTVKLILREKVPDYVQKDTE